MTTDNEEVLNRLLALERKLDALPLAEIGKILQITNDLIGASHNRLHEGLSFLTREISNIKQSVGLSSMRSPVPKGRPIRCIFIVNFIASWATYADIFSAMKDASDFDPIVITVQDDEETRKRYNRDSEEDAHQGLSKLGIPHLRFNMPDSYVGLHIIKMLAPDIIFRQSPWDQSLAPAYRTTELSFARLCHISYSFNMPRKFRPYENDPAEGEAAAYHADQYFHQMCWRIFCETDMHRDMYARASTRGSDNLVVTGYTKFDNLLRSARQNPPSWPLANADGKKHFRVIWAPHFSVMRESLGFGMFHVVYKDMLAWAHEHPDIEFVLRPHPLTFLMLVEHKIMSHEDVDTFLASWDALTNTARDNEVDYAPLFAASDTMITDGVGFFAEYQLFEKPLIFMDSGRHTGFNESGKIVMESANRVTTVREARALCERLQKGEMDPMRDIQKKNLPFIMPYPGKSAQNVLNAIRDGLAYERGQN